MAAAQRRSAGGGPPPLVADRIAKTYDQGRQPVPVIADLSLTLEPGRTVSLVGPMRMDYVKAIDAVRAAARELSRFVEDVYEDN